MAMYDNELKTKENKNWTKEKIEPQHTYWLSCLAGVQLAKDWGQGHGT